MPLFKPILAGATLRDRIAASLAAALAVALILFLDRVVPTPGGVPILVAALGSTAVLVFAIPASPLTQPWSVIGGNIVSALAGIAAFHAFPGPALAGGMAVGGSILAMSLLRCLHPPGGAVALATVIGGPTVYAAGWSFAFVPVGTNSVLIVLLAMLYHAVSGHSYPHRAAAAPSSAFARADMDAALEEMHESFDIAREDLDALLARAEAHAQARTRR